MPSDVFLDAQTLSAFVPYTPPFSLLDAVESYAPREKRLVAVKNLSQSEPFLRGHFPGYPIFPGVLIIESLAQACRVLMHVDFLSEQGTPPEAMKDLLRQESLPRGFLVESSIKHSEGAYPGDRLHLQAQLTSRKDDLYTFKVSARVGVTEVGRGKIVLLRSSCEVLPS